MTAMYDNDGAEKRLQFNSYPQQRSCSHTSTEEDEDEDSERVLNSHGWVPISIPIYHAAKTHSRNYKGISFNPTTCTFHELSYPVTSLSREEDLLKLTVNPRLKASHRVIEKINTSLVPPVSRGKRFHDDKLFMSSEPTSKKAAATLNHPYSREHLHCVRYLKEDLHLAWNRVFEQFHRIFSSQPGFIERESEAALTSRSYRDNFIYASINGKPLLNCNGMPIRVQAKVRQRLIAEDKHVPVKLVEKHPSWAVKYSWVSPEHRVTAQAIIDGSNPDYYNSKKDQHRRVIEEAEKIEEKLMRNATGADRITTSTSRLIITTPSVSPGA